MSKQTPLKSPVLLDKSHVVMDFDCGSAPLNKYLVRFAYENNRNRSSRTYVAARDKKVVGFYTLTPGSVSREDAPSRVTKGLANHPIPVIILARLAVDTSEKGTGLGKGLLKDALARIVEAADIIGGRAVLVHGKDDAAKSFYQKFGFEQSPLDPFHLFLLLKDIKKTLNF